MPSTKLPPTVRSIPDATTTLPEITGQFVPPRGGKGKVSEVARGALLKRAVDIKPMFFSLNADALDPHLAADSDKVFFHGRSADMEDPTVHCTVEEGKGFKPGKLSLAFLSEAQREKYNRMHPDKPQVERAGPVVRVCAAPGKPLLMPVKGFNDAYEKANRVRDCVLGERNEKGKRPGKGDSPEACAFKVAGRSLAIAGLRRRKKR